MRATLLILVVLLAGCQSSDTEKDYSPKPAECDARAADSGLCTPGEYEDSDY
jgi:PBP1b-binding outer membrane lipoprotein LpoB